MLISIFCIILVGSYFLALCDLVQNYIEMPMKICRFLFILIFVLGRLCVGGADLNYLSKLSISEGLPHNGVTAILQDAKGYMWIATYDGLCRYDGYECKVFRNNFV